MNVACIICSDLIASHGEVYSTHCGHVFHYACLIQWLERSKTCPQCRNKASEKTIHRIYLNIANTDAKADVATLQSSLDNAQFQLMLKEKDIKNFKEKYSKMKEQNGSMRNEIIELEGQLRSHDSVVLALKEQISFYKSKARERDKYVEEITKLKTRLKQMEAIDTAINGTREEVTDMLKNGNDVDSLVILVATLKKALLDAEKKKIYVEHKFKQAQNELTSNKREVMVLDMTNKDLRKELEELKSSSSRAPILPKIPKRPLQESKVKEDEPDTACSLETISVSSSPSVSEEGEKSSDALDSPYLNLKKCGPALNVALHKRKTVSDLSVLPKEMSIFKKVKPNIDTARSCQLDRVMYNGLGGQSKEDLYPTPKLAEFKRRRVDPTTSYKKFRKMSVNLTLKH